MEYAAQPVEVAREESTFLQRVFLWMFVGLAITGGVAAAIGSSDKLLTDITESPGIVIGVIVLQLALVLGLVFLLPRISVGLATFLFLLYSATVGVTFAFIFELYTTQSIFTAFLVTAGMFGALAVWGAVTHIDLSKVGSIAFMALIGLILATDREHLLGEQHALLDHHVRGCRDLRRAHRLRHAEAQADQPAGTHGRGRGTRGDHGRALASTSTSSISSSSCCGSSARSAS